MGSRRRHSSKLPHSLALAILLAAALALSASAQTTGRVAGRVTDAETGAPLPFADVMVIGLGIGSATDARGEYLIDFIPAGTQTIQASFVGFAIERVEVVVEVDRTLDLDFALEVKPFETPILDVYGDRDLTDIDQTATVRHKDREEMDVRTILNLVDALETEAGVVEKEGEIHVRGGRSTEVKIYVDGIAITDPATGNTSLEVNLTALTGYELLSGGFDAEYGNVQSGVINLSTREGSETFSGEVSYMTDDYGAPERTYDNFDMASFGLGGPLFFDGLTYYVSAQGNVADTYLRTSKVMDEREIAGINVKERQSMLASGQGKLAYSPGGGKKLTFEYLRSEAVRDDYVHFLSRTGYWSAEHEDWSHVPLDTTYAFYNAPDHTPTERTTFIARKLVWRDAPSENFFYTIRLAQLESSRENKLHEDPNSYWWQAYVGGNRVTDPDADGDLNPEPGYYQVWGDNLAWSENLTKVTTFKADMTKESLDKSHQFKTGFEVASSVLDVRALNLGALIPSAGDTSVQGFRFFDWNRALNTDERYQHNIYRGFPTEGAVFVQDKMTYDGMIVRGGLRFDWMDPGAASSVGQRQIWRERVKAVLSPRLGIAHPISDKDALHFHYGRFYQIPHLSVLYTSGESLDEAPAGRIIGYSGLGPEVTTAYQFGAQHQFTENLAIDVTGYYKDIFGLLAVEEYSRGPTEGSVWPYVNKDYASVKGVEFKLTKRFSNYFMGNISYAVMQATGVSSDENQGAQQEAEGLPRQPLKEIPLEWDERHTLTGFLFVSDPGNWEVTFDYSYGSGTPYTPRFLGQKVIDPESVNSGRIPSRQVVDIKGRKRYTLYGQEFSLFFEALNVFDKRNVIDLGFYGDEYYTMTGNLGGAYVETGPDGRERLEPLDDPSTFEEGRTIRVGITVDW